MYQDPNMLASIRKVEAAREENIKLDPRRMTADEKDALLKKFHPDYRTEQFTELRFGPNKGQKVPLELADLLEGESRVLHEQFDLTKPDYETDVLIIGGGGAGCSAAIEADKAGAKVMVVTKLRMGDANTMMAEGGIQAADKPNDSPAQHFLDAYGGGHFAAQKDLLYKLVMDAPEAIQWLSGLGVEFDKAPDGTMITTHGGGTSRKRMHAAKDYSGAEIMRTLRDEVLNRGIPVVDFTSAIELIKDENGHCAGAILLNMETKELLVAKAKTVILATGGAGRLHYQGFPTSNHYGATADGLVLGYRAGAKLLYPDTLQYHPTGAAYPAQIYGALVTEKVRSVGAMLVNADGEVFMNPLETRDVAAASIIRECTERGKGVRTPAGQAVWLDTPMIELKNGKGTIEKRIPAMMRMFAKHGIDIRTEPILVYPTLHYQNGGLHITPDGQTDVENLFAAGEVVGGIHGRNRLMGNSLLDVIVFGRNAGQHAAEKAKSVTVGALTLSHVAAFEAEKQQAGVSDHRPSPQLLPDSARKIHPVKYTEEALHLPRCSASREKIRGEKDDCFHQRCEFPDALHLRDRRSRLSARADHHQGDQPRHGRRLCHRAGLRRVFRHTLQFPLRHPRDQLRLAGAEDHRKPGPRVLRDLGRLYRRAELLQEHEAQLQVLRAAGRGDHPLRRPHRDLVPARRPGHRVRAAGL